MKNAFVLKAASSSLPRRNDFTLLHVTDTNSGLYTFKCVYYVLYMPLHTWHTLHSSHLISSHLISSHLISSHLISSHLISSHLISSHLISSHLISSHLIYVYSFNLYGRTREDILYHWHISWDYTIIILLSHLSHGLFFPILFARSRSVDELCHLWLNIGRNS